MAEIVFTYWDLEIVTVILLMGFIVYVVVKSYCEDRRLKKNRGDN